jgi:hypothetical protein
MPSKYDDHLTLEFSYIGNVTNFIDEFLTTQKCLRKTKVFMPLMQDKNTTFTNQLLPNILLKMKVLCCQYKCCTYLLLLFILYFTLGSEDSSRIIPTADIQDGVLEKSFSVYAFKLCLMKSRCEKMKSLTETLYIIHY